VVVALAMEKEQARRRHVATPIPHVCDGRCGGGEEDVRFDNWKHVIGSETMSECQSNGGKKSS
jgi:hypothetical protein